MLLEYHFSSGCTSKMCYFYIFKVRQKWENATLWIGEKKGGGEGNLRAVVSMCGFFHIFVKVSQ